MVKILIADDYLKLKHPLLDNILTKEKYLILENTSSDSDLLLDKYNEFNPHIFISDIKNLNIINHLTNTPSERNICNIILTTTNTNIKLVSVSKIHKIIYNKDNILDIIEAVQLIENSHILPTLDLDELNILLIKLYFHLDSLGTKYIIQAINCCYYSPEKIALINSVFDEIAKNNNLTINQVRESIRCSLIPLNKLRDKCSSPIIKYFDEYINITPKYFLEVIVSYLRIKAKKRNK